MKPALTVYAIAMLACWQQAHADVTCRAYNNTAIPATTPTVNFEDHGDGTVTDTTTGLMWMRCTLGKEWHAGTSCVRAAMIYDWQSALWVAQAINSGVSNADHDLAPGFAGHADWRLPNKNELASIVEERCGPSVNEAIFPNMQSPMDFWSSTPSVRSSNQAWLLSFESGEINPQLKTGAYKVRLVRAGR
ncbi:MAG: DUF1566 domain-containing protein [Saccharospirillum sp.]|nr:DUF1566 domain-containing protein [Saccharospirillum sp.]